MSRFSKKITERSEKLSSAKLTPKRRGESPLAPYTPKRSQKKRQNEKDFKVEPKETKPTPCGPDQQWACGNAYEIS